LTNYIIRRLIAACFILVFLSIAVFALLRIAPGNDALLQAGGGFIDQAQVEALKKEKGLDRPYFPISFKGHREWWIPVPDPPFITVNSDNQYSDWAGNVLQGDLGKSQLSGVPISTALIDRMPTTLELLALTMFFTIVIGVPAGAISAMYRNSPADLSVRLVAILFLSIPGFWIGTLVILIPAERWGYAPPIGNTVSLWENPWDNFRQFVPPALVLGTAASATIMRLTRSSLLEVLRADYIRTARAKGLRDGLVIYRHALKNVMIPIVTVLGLQFTGLLGGTIFVELIFGIKGLGFFTYEAIFRKDYNAVQGITLYIAVVVVLTQLFIDILYAWIDPRIRYA
jgi:peptide/nickel transport system permease protein